MFWYYSSFLLILIVGVVRSQRCLQYDQGECEGSLGQCGADGCLVKGCVSGQYIIGLLLFFC
jgi:hypothetical protein